MEAAPTVEHEAAIDGLDVSQSPTGPGFPLPMASLYEHAFQRGARPLWTPIPSKAVLDAEERCGWGSAEHMAALERSKLARDAYLRGEGWPVIEERPSPQERLFYRREYEALIGGAKGGGKTAGCMLWMVSGNPHEPVYDVRGRPIMYNISYVFHPRFAGLVLRLNEKDLDEWVREARPLYRQLGGEWVGRPSSVFRFPSGAVIYTGHLDDENSYLKYWGKSIIRIAVEELTHIPEERAYRMIRSCCRSPVPELVAQIRNTTNPPGPGAGWVFDYFIEPKSRNDKGELDSGKPLLGEDGKPIKAFDDQGKPVYPEPVVRETAVNPFTNKTGTLTRTFIPARLDDNPHLLHNDQYVMTLATMGPDERDALLLGKWNMQVGAYFKLFRPTGPIAELHEPVNANHVIHTPRPEHDALPLDAHARRYAAKPLAAWWPRAIGGDWGYEHDAAFYWGCRRAPDDVMEIYRELVLNNTVPEQVGFEVARASLPDLNNMARYDVPPRITLWIGMDVERETIGGGRSVIELMARGVAQVLGPGRVHLPDFDVARLTRDATDRGEVIDREAIERIYLQQHAGLTIRRAPNQRVAGWHCILSALRWWPLASDTNAYVDFDPEHAYRTLVEGGQSRCDAYVQSCLRAGVEVLPQLQIRHDECPRLREALPKFQRSERTPEDCDKTHFSGMDCGDALRYLLMGARSEVYVEPKLAYVDRRAGEIMAGEPDMSLADKARVYDRVEQDWQQDHAPVPVGSISGARLARLLTAAQAGAHTDRQSASQMVAEARGRAGPLPPMLPVGPIRRRRGAFARLSRGGMQLPLSLIHRP